MNWEILSPPGVTLWKGLSFGALGCLLAEQQDVHELKFLQEFENQVTEFHPQRFIVVADDVCGVLLNLNEGFCLLEEYDVALGRVLHLHVTEAMLDVVLGREQKREMLLQLRKTGRDEGQNGYKIESAVADVLDLWHLQRKCA